MSQPLLQPALHAGRPSIIGAACCSMPQTFKHVEPTPCPAPLHSSTELAAAFLCVRSVTDDLDRRCLMSVLRQFICPRVVQQEGAALTPTPSGAYCVPKEGGLESYLESIRGLPR